MDCEVLLAFILKKPTSFLFAHKEDSLSFSQSSFYRWLIFKRARNWPVAYLTQKKEFYGLEFVVNRNVLIPRPDTETLVEEVIRYFNSQHLCRPERSEADRNEMEGSILNSQFPPPPRTNSQSDSPVPLSSNTLTVEHFCLVDVGTGSGCIAVSILKNVPGLSAIATDISGVALQMAQMNVKKHGVKDRLELRQMDLLSGFKQDELSGQAVIITANLPYVPLDWSPHASTAMEPNLALTTGDKGLFLYKKFIQELEIIKPKMLFLEMFEFQTGLLKRCFLNYKLILKKRMTGEACLTVFERISE